MTTDKGSEQLVQRMANAAAQAVTLARGTVTSGTHVSVCIILADVTTTPARPGCSAIGGAPCENMVEDAHEAEMPHRDMVPIAGEAGIDEAPLPRTEGMLAREAVALLSVGRHPLTTRAITKAIQKRFGAEQVDARAFERFRASVSRALNRRQDVRCVIWNGRTHWVMRDDDQYAGLPDAKRRARAPTPKSR